MLPLEPVCRLTDLDERGRILLAAITKELPTRYDNLFRVPFLTLWGGMGAVRGRRPSPLAAPCAFLPSAAAIGQRQKVYGRIRDAWRLTPEQAAAHLRDGDARIKAVC